MYKPYNLMTEKLFAHMTHISLLIT